MKTIRDIDVEGKVILLRADLNLPMDEAGEIMSDLRLRAVLPTIEYLRENGARKIYIISHLGRPEGRDERYTMKRVAERFRELYGDVVYVDDVAGEKVKRAGEVDAKGTKSDEAMKCPVIILENLRFYPGEKAGDAEFIRAIIESTGAEVYVQDAFAVLHRKHASVVAAKDVCRELGVAYVYGLLVEKEVEGLSRVVTEPERPLVVIIGGAKVEDKQPLIDKFAGIADKIIVGGKIAADGYTTDLPNVYVAEDFDTDAEGNGVDVGPVSMSKVVNEITDAATVVWNGLLGKTEDPAYATASTIVAEMMGEKYTATTVVCGGDTTGFVEELMDEHPSLDYTLISTGGGAALEFLLNGTLVGLE